MSAASGFTMGAMPVLTVLSDSKSEHYWPSQKLFNVFLVLGRDVRVPLALVRPAGYKTLQVTWRCSCGVL